MKAKRRTTQRGRARRHVPLEAFRSAMLTSNVPECVTLGHRVEVTHGRMGRALTIGDVATEVNLILHGGGVTDVAAFLTEVEAALPLDVREVFRTMVWVRWV